MILQEKYPKGREVDENIILEQTSAPPQPVIFEAITAESVQKVAKNMKGSGGPSLVDADTWKDFLCSKAFGNTSLQLCQAVADLAKILCTEEIHPDCLTEYLASRLIPLDKGTTKEGKPGVRPIGVGEVIRRLVGKLLIGVIKDDIVSAAGPLQTCSGLKSGIEAAIHAMRQTYEDHNTEAILLVDAENAFNNLNRNAALKNIKEICPPFYRYLSNTYEKPAKLVIPGEEKYDIIYSEEGCTQGDVTAMGLYGLGIKPLTDNLSDTIDIEKCKQVWYADDSSSAGELNEMKKWWDKLCEMGPKYGYFPLATKTILIVKKEFETKAQQIFGESGVKISTRGERHMGAVIGSAEYKEEYVSLKVNKWVEDVEELANIAKDEPQATYASYTKAICHRWTYIQRTIPDIGCMFTPLENTIREKLIPSLIGRKVSDIERRIIALPVRLGGLGIANPVTSAYHEYSASSYITQNLTEVIFNQEKDFTNYKINEVHATIKDAKNIKDKRLQEEYNKVIEEVDVKTKRVLELALEKGSGSWLTALPIKSLGYILNKQEFKDSISLRYGWKIPNTPSYCQCGSKNDIDHALSCKKGGYVTMRHNNIRDLEAELMKEVCFDVKVEPVLLPLDTDIARNGNTAEKARLDVSGVGVWGPLEKTFLDVRIMHPNAPSYINKNIKQVYSSHEKEKKRTYNERVLQVEKASFTPIVMSTFGGMGNEADRHHKRIAELISQKKKESYADVLTYVRTRLRFSLLKSILMAIRGIRGRKVKNDDETAPISSLSFNLIAFNDRD